MYIEIENKKLFKDLKDLKYAIADTFPPLLDQRDVRDICNQYKKPITILECEQGFWLIEFETPIDLIKE